MAVQVISPDYNNITREFIQSVLNYDLETGFFTWKDTRYSRKIVRVGERAEHVMIRDTNHLAINLFPYSFSAARLAILYVTGERVYNAPKHVNGDNADNRISNLSWVAKKRENEKVHRFPVLNKRYIELLDGDIEYLHGLLNKFIQEHGHWDSLQNKWIK